jgi:hypothetical protein
LSGKPAISDKELVHLQESIMKTMRTFRETPDAFWSKGDVLCHLKGLLLKRRLFREGRTGNVFLGFPTRNTYERRDDGTIFASEKGRSERFALAGWSSATPTSSSHLTQRLSFAVEASYSRLMDDSWTVQIRNSLLKLSDDANHVPPSGRLLLLLARQQIPIVRKQLDAILAEYSSVRCYQQLAQ